MVLVAADHQVDTVLVEQRAPRFAHAEVAAAALVAGDVRLVHADDDPVDVAVRTSRLQLAFQPAALRATRVAADVRVAAVLVGHIAVGEADDAHRAGGERVPEALELVVRAGVRRGEVRLIGRRTDRAVVLLVLVVADTRHPRPEARRAAVADEPVRPRLHAVGAAEDRADRRVAEVAVDQVEQRIDALDRGDDVGGGLRADRVGGVHRVRAVRGRRARRELDFLAEVRGALVAEAGESERPAAPRRGLEHAAFRRRALVACEVDVPRARLKLRQARVVDEDLDVVEAVPVVPGLRLHTAAQSGFRGSVLHARLRHRLEGQPGHHHLARRVRAELEVKARDAGGAERARLVPQQRGAGRPRRFVGRGGRSGRRAPDDECGARGAASGEYGPARNRHGTPLLVGACPPPRGPY